MPKLRKITIIGSSVALRVRPPVGNKNNYGVLLENKLNKISNETWIVLNKGFGRATTKEIVIKSDEYIRTFPDVFILNLGAVEAPSREVPLWYSDIIYKRRRSIFSSLLIKTYYSIIIKNRRFFTMARLKKSWVNKKDYLKDIEDIVTKISKDTNAQIVILGINKGNERMENILPGTLKKYKEYSDCLEALSKENNIAFIPVNDLSDIEHFPDGVHYNEKGHIEIANRIFNVFENRLELFSQKSTD